MTGLKKGEVHLEEHDPEWETEAERLKERLHKVLGDQALDVQHVGSTSIRTIPAKPILDIAVAVNDVEDVDAYKDKMEKAGFQYAGELNAGQRMFFMENAEGRVIQHIHMVQEGSAAWTNYMNMRDYLNAEPKEAERYAQLKRKLSKSCEHDRAAYAEGKDPFIKETLRKAAEWRSAHK